ncbi:MAG: hypothetical protein ACON4U_12965 [Myxococcota bacterium]
MNGPLELKAQYEHAIEAQGKDIGKHANPTHAVPETVHTNCISYEMRHTA